jgi:RimJ/RimL family protein N-acetyltransferase
MIASKHRRKGFASEAVAMVVDYLFLTKELVRIQAIIYEENVGLKRSLEKAGFKREDVNRKMLYGFGQYWDVTLYSILREEWKKPKILPAAPV